MSEKAIRYPKLTKFYRSFLCEEDSARFIKNVSDNHMIGTLQRLYSAGDRNTRRAAILAIGFMGDFSLNETIGGALSDSDRAVRLLAEHNIRQIWHRQGSPREQQLLHQLIALNSSKNSNDAVQLATELISSNELFGEAWNQRAIAFSELGDYPNSVNDSREALNCNRFHFPAAVAMGQCYLQIEDAFNALDSFRLALSINPDLECLRSQIRKLENMLEDS